MLNYSNIKTEAIKIIVEELDEPNKIDDKILIGCVINYFQERNIVISVKDAKEMLCRAKAEWLYKILNKK